ncbi:MAG: BsuPI-related putative proteinase inhibitor [Armatimonadetes bacterium]|nr:BsuPI-related putative proteinase inhibitor [Armatimonadota bacterium]
MPVARLVVNMNLVAVVALVNGVQINMPAPALLLEGRAWVPLRAVVQRLGYRVEVGGGQVVVEGRGVRLMPPETRKIGAVTYVPARWLEKLGAKVAYNPAKRTVSLSAALSGGQASGGAAEGEKPLLARIIEDPAAWADQAVTVRGECLGWRARPLFPALAFGPPRTRSDWVLRGDGGALYCTGRLPADMTSKIGQRLDVQGTVRLAGRGWPYLEVVAMSRVSGHEGLCCCLTTGAATYGLTDNIALRLLVRNDGDEPVELKFPSGKTYDFFLRDVARRLIWRWSDGRVFTMAIVERTLSPGESYEVREALDLSSLADLRKGIYYLSAELPGITQSYDEPVEVNGRQ